MAESVALFLKAAGADIAGESTVHGLGRENSIEVVKFEQSVATAREAGTSQSTGRRQYQPLSITKRIDKSTPLLFKALVENQDIEATFKFYRPNPAGDGTTQQFFTIAIKQGRIASAKQVLPNVLEPALGQDSNLPPMEEIAFTFHTITQTYEDGGVTHEDTWSNAR